MTKKWTKEVHRQYCKEYYWKNKPRRQQYNKLWKEQHPDWMKNWYLDNQEGRRKKHQMWNLTHKEQQRIYRRRRREQWKQYCYILELTSCSFCGYSKCWRALDFHHTDPKKKESKTAYLMSLSFTEKNKNRFLSELPYMILLCANCHRELHAAEEDQKD